MQIILNPILLDQKQFIHEIQILLIVRRVQSFLLNTATILQNRIRDEHFQVYIAVDMNCDRTNLL